MLVAFVVASATAGPAGAEPDPGGRAVIAVLPYQTSVEQIATVPDLAPGVISAGLGSVPVAQTFLDISQGNRVNQNLYDGELPRLYVQDGRVPARLWGRVVDRADSAPANIVPGLLATTLADAGVPVGAEADSGLATLIGVDRDGAAPIAADAGSAPGLSVIRIRLGELRQLAEGLGPDDLLIAVAAGARADQELLPAGIAGPGYAGNLTSASTRTDGVVLTTDIGPTVLEHLGVEVPDEFNGSEITSGDDRDPEAVADLQSRLDHRPSRDTVVLLPLLIWLALTGLATLVWRAPGARVALRLLALSAAWAPLILLGLAAPDAGPLASALAVGLGAPALALATDRLLSPCAGLALACGLTVAAYAVDVVAGSPLTALSVLGPNPGAGVRFFGIGNELEAILTTLALIGTGAWLETRPDVDGRRAAAWFVGVAGIAAAAFAPGRFGADVGAAIVLAVGAATAAVIVLGLERRRAILVVVGGGAAALVALVAIDAALGGAHLSRSVLGAGEAGDVVDVFDRRLRLMVHTFTHPVYPELLVACGALLVTGVVRRRRVSAWFGDRWAARAGYLGAVAGVLLGTVANDSGSVLLVIGTIYLAICAGYYWATQAENRAA
jgi:cell division protein FtsW (lipid II flippase)